MLQLEHICKSYTTGTFTQIALDEVNDCVYFAYRNNGKVTANYPNTGIYCYNLVSGAVTCLIDGVSVYGVAVNNTPSKLF
jgi:hypothetical protein